MACNVPLIAASVGSMQSFFKNREDWLFVPEDPEGLARVLENRIKDKNTNYENVLTWSEIALQMEKIIQNICKTTL